VESPGGVSVVYVTHRHEPAFAWFADGLAAQLRDDDVEVIVIDGLHTLERSERFQAIVQGRFDLRHVPAKPTPYSGACRLTPKDYFAIASARNTGIVYATKPYVAFVDDCCVLGPNWWSEVRAAATGGYVVAGSFQKHYEMVVEAGALLDSKVRPEDVDSRWPQGDDDSIVAVGGGQLFGCSFAAPRSLLVGVEGVDELCDPIGGEDYHLGLRLEWSGAEIFYSRRMLTIESVELHDGGPELLRIGRVLEPPAYLERLREFGISERILDGDWDSSMLVLEILLGTRNTRSIGNYYVLDELTEASLDHLPERFPGTYWVDGTPLAELR
jgi:Glycosyl transferase family 2